jgi:outer membrane protein
MKYVSLVFVSLLAALVPASAELKVAVVDYVRVAKEYSKTKDASSKIQERVDRAKQELQDREDDLRKSMVEVNKLGEESNDKSLSEAARKEKATAFNTKREDFMRDRAKFEQEKGERARKIQEFDRMTAQEVWVDATKAIKEVSTRDKYSLIFNIGEFGQPYGQLSVITFGSDVKDITDDIIKTLNAGYKSPASSAPAAAVPTPAPKK